MAVVPDSTSVERRGRHAKSSGSGASVETFIPHCDGDLVRTESEGTCEMNCVGSAQSVQDSQLASHSLDVGRELDWTHRRPEDLPFACCSGRFGFGEVVITARYCERCADFGIRKPTRQRSVASVPHGCQDCLHRPRRGTSRRKGTAFKPSPTTSLPHRPRRPRRGLPSRRHHQPTRRRVRHPPNDRRRPPRPPRCPAPRRLSRSPV